MLIYISCRCWVFLWRARHRKNTLAGVDGKFDHTLFDYVKMSKKLICMVLNLWFSIYSTTCLIKTMKIQNPSILRMIVMNRNFKYYKVHFHNNNNPKPAYIRIRTLMLEKKIHFQYEPE